MTFKIPQHYIERGKIAYEEIMNGKQKDKSTKESEKQNSSEPFSFKNPNITKSDYVQIPGTGRVISKYEVSGYNNMNWQNTNFKLQENGLYMPTPKLFTAHFMNVLDCYQNDKPLYDAAGSAISKKEKEDIALHILKDHIAVYGNQKGAWTWLDAFFEEEKGKMKMFSEHLVQKDLKGKKVLVPQKTEDLEACLVEDGFADLVFNSQGLSVRRSSNQSYELGKNIYFWFPRNKRVARFDADSDRAYLYCGRDPSNSCSGLGVYAVAPDKQ